MNDMDKLLKAALAPEQYPPEELNDKLMRQVKVKESGEMRWKRKSLIIAAAVVACLLIVPASAYAAYKYLQPKEAAIKLQDDKLGKAFEKDGTEAMETVTDGLYKVTYLGDVSGEYISERTGSSWDMYPERTYVAVAIEKADGTDMTDEDNSKLFVTPLIQGLKPWVYNIASMHGSYMGDVIDGVFYRIIECDSVELFADRDLYLAVSDTAFFSRKAFDYDEETGVVTPNEAYEGTNILFDMKLDSSKSDPEKAKAYLKQLDDEWNLEGEQNKANGRGEETEVKPVTQQEIFAEGGNKVTFRMDEEDFNRWWADDKSARTVLSYYLDVEGEDIESIKCTLNQGEFCSNPADDLTELKTYGNQCSITGDDLKDRNHLYSAELIARFETYKDDPVFNDNSAWGKREHDMLSMGIASTKLTLEINMKDGRTVNKNLSFNNASDESIDISVSEE